MKKKKKDFIDKTFRRWVYRLGLRWWTVDIIYYKKPPKKYFDPGKEDGVIRAVASADWRYCTLVVRVNMPSFKYLEKWRIEIIVVHELVHALVNEMHSHKKKRIDHEERVVTGLTKAFLWTAQDAREPIDV